MLFTADVRAFMSNATTLMDKLRAGSVEEEYVNESFEGIQDKLSKELLRVCHIQISKAIRKS